MDSDNEMPPMVELIDLASFQCKWPYEGQWCCGRVREIGKPYCSEHQRRSLRGGEGLRNPEAFSKKPKPRPTVTLLIEDIG